MCDKQQQGLKTVEKSCVQVGKGKNIINMMKKITRVMISNVALCVKPTHPQYTPSIS